MFDDLGVVEAVLEHGEWRQDITLYKNRRQLARLPAGLAEPRPDLPYPNIVMIPQWRTTAVLAERLRELGGTIPFGTRLDEFTARRPTNPAGRGRMDASATGRNSCGRGLGKPLRRSSGHPARVARQLLDIAAGAGDQRIDERQQPIPGTQRVQSSYAVDRGLGQREAARLAVLDV